MHLVIRAVDRYIIRAMERHRPWRYDSDLVSCNDRAAHSSVSQSCTKSAVQYVTRFVIQITLREHRVTAPILIFDHAMTLRMAKGHSASHLILLPICHVRLIRSVVHSVVYRRQQFATMTFSDHGVT